MKKMLLWIAAILVMFGCSQKKTNEFTVLGFGTQYMNFPEHLKGKVKEMHETNYWAVEQDGKYIKGNPMTWKDLDSLGSLQNTRMYFDEAGKLIKQENLDENNSVRNSISVVSENGKPVRWDRMRADTIYSYYKPEYNSEGKEIGGKNFRAGVDTLINTIAISFDDMGNYTKLEVLNYKNVKASSTTYAYDGKGHISELQFMNAKDSLVQKFIQRFDENGFMTEQLVEAAEPADWKFTLLKSDDHGNWTQQVQDIYNGKIRFITERTYIYY